MKISPRAGILLLALSSAAFAQRPPVYPLRSQTAATQSVDNAYCYWQARQQTGVDMTHLSQRPPRTKRAPFTPDAGKGTSEPPLPGAGNAPTDRSSEASHAGSRAGPEPGSAAAASTGHSETPPAVGRAAAPSGASGSAHAAAAAAGASSPVAGSAASASAAPDATATRLPPPPPPMTAYWQAYGDCMHERGYGVQ
jgi:hypothetical protein